MQSGPWPEGINNRQAEHAMPKDSNGNDVALRNAVNVDLDSSGFAARRQGYSRVADLSGSHSGWSGPNSGAFIVQGFNLYKLASDLTKTLLATGIVGRMAYCEVGDTVFMSDGQRSWKYTNGALSTWGASTTVEDGTITSPPAGRIIRHHNGRIYIAAENAVHYTEPFAFEWYRPATNFIMFPSTVSVVEPVSDGIWIVADKSYFYAGGQPKDFQVVKVADYGATFGTSVRNGNRDEAIWHSDVGPVVGRRSGEFAQLSFKNYASAPAELGAAMVRRTDGKGQYVVSLTAPAVSTMAASEWVEAENTRKGV